MNLYFLSLDQVLKIHKNQIELYGGKDGIRDLSLLSSAIAMPKLSFENQFLHEDIFKMAAAYAFHISNNHPFVDGNKRTALVAAILFLRLNNIKLKDPKGILYNAMIKLSSNQMGKDEFAKALEELAG